MQPNKQGFVFLVSSATIKTPENLIETFSEHIMIASEKVDVLLLLEHSMGVVLWTNIPECFLWTKDILFVQI